MLGGGEVKHTLAVLVENQPGVLSHVAGSLPGGVNIESLAVGRTETPPFPASPGGGGRRECHRTGQ